MSITSRPYNGIQDFVLMTSILAVGRKTTNHSYYVHVGDLSWRMFYSDADPSQWIERIRLWEHDGRPCGWSLIDPDWYSFDMYLLPEMRGSKEETYILDWTINRAAEAVKQHGGHQIRTVWVSEGDKNRVDQLKERGFERAEAFMWYLEHSLNTGIPGLKLPQDYAVRSVRGETDLHRRARASHRAFGSTRNFDDYWPRYQRFMHSPVYNPNFDLVTEAPDGQFTSFCIVWPDPVNHIGLVEPVGTHPDFQRQGMGRCVVSAGLRQLGAWGMNRAMICAENDNQAAIKLYKAIGFETKFKLHTYLKQV